MKHAAERTVLLVDAWGGFKKMSEGAETTKNVRIEYIPEGTMGIVQSWDVFGARPLKNYVRRLSELLKTTFFSTKGTI